MLGDSYGIMLFITITGKGAEGERGETHAWGRFGGLTDLRCPWWVDVKTEGRAGTKISLAPVWHIPRKLSRGGCFRFHLGSCWVCRQLGLEQGRTVDKCQDSCEFAKASILFYSREINPF